MRIKRHEKREQLEFPLIGKIKIGKKSAQGFPQSIDYFIATGSYAKFFTDAYGEKPNKIQIIFTHDDHDKVCSEMYVLRDSEGRRVAYGDGVLYYVYNERTALYDSYLASEHEGIHERLEKKHNSKFEVVLTLRFLIPRISGIMGYWELQTKGDEVSIPSIVETFDSMKEQNGFVKGVIFDLKVEFHTSNKPKLKRRYPVLSLVPNHSKQNLEMVKSHLMLGNQIGQIDG